MTFSTTGPRNRTVRVPEPKDNLNAGDVTAAASNLINATPFDVASGALTTLLRADVVKEVRTVVIPQV